VAGQVLGGVLVSADVLGSQWRSIFFVNVPVGLAVIAAGARHLPREEDERDDHEQHRGRQRGDARDVDAPPRPPAACSSPAPTWC
jgi:MFS family permease